MYNGTLTKTDQSSEIEFQTRAHAPKGWVAYRFGLILCGLLWVFLSSTLCGCGTMNGYVMNRSGKKYYDKGNYEYARYEFERALMDDPHNANYAFNVARTMELEGEYENAESMYQHALTLDPNHMPSYHSLASMLKEQGRTGEARELLTAWADTQPYSANAQRSVAGMYQQEGNYQAAQQHYHQASLNVPQGRSRRMARRSYGPPAPQYASAPAGRQMASPRFPYHTPPSLQMAQTMPTNDFTMMGGPVVSNHSMASSSPMMHGQPVIQQQPMMSPSVEMPMQHVPTPQQYNSAPMLNSGEPQLLPEVPASNGPQAYYPQQVVSQQVPYPSQMNHETPTGTSAQGAYTEHVMMPTQAMQQPAPQVDVYQPQQAMGAGPFQNISTQTTSSVVPAVQAF